MRGLFRKPVAIAPECAQAFAYEADVTDEAVAKLQARANKILDEADDWVVIDGHDPGKAT